MENAVKRGGGRRENYTPYESEIYPAGFFFSLNQNQIIFLCYIVPGAESSYKQISHAHK